LTTGDKIILSASLTNVSYHASLENIKITIQAYRNSSIISVNKIKSSRIMNVPTN